MFDVNNILGVGARLQARRIDETIKEFIGSILIATTTTDLADASSLPMTSFVERWKPEIDVCLELGFYALSTSYKASPGMKAFGFSYSKKGNSMALIACIMCKWFYCRLHRISIYKHWRAAAEGTLEKKLWRLIKVLDAVMQVLSFANHLSFLSARASSSSETYPDLKSRVSGYGWAPVSVASRDGHKDISSRTNSNSNSSELTMPPLPAWGRDDNTTCSAPEPGPGPGPGSSSGVSLLGGGGGGASRAEGQQMTRLVAWQAVQGLALAVAMLLDWRQLAVTAKRYTIDLYYRSAHYLKSHVTLGNLYSYFLNPKYIPEFLLQFLKPTVTSGGGVGGVSGSNSEEGDSLSSANTAATRGSDSDSDSCAICGLQSPEAPHAGECGHVCCFHCLSTNIHIGRYRCPTCGVLLTCCNRL